MLEFDPDEKSIEKEFREEGEASPLHSTDREQQETIAYLGEVVNLEEEAFKKLLQNKFTLFRTLLQGTIEHPMHDARITIEQARRLATYTHSTYFRHLRLYDFVLKNTKLSEVKRVFLPVASPQCGDELSKAITLFDSEQDKK